MLKASKSSGICPGCEVIGVISHPCQEPVCAKRGLHLVPLAFAPEDSGPDDVFIGRKVGDYLLVKVLGLGGMGAVYLGIDTNIGLRVALKLMSTQHVPDKVAVAMRKKFEDEALALARIQHPNIVRIHRFGTVRANEEEVPYLAMEFVGGARTLNDDMNDRIANEEWYSIDDAERILTEILDGLAAAHQAGVIHRDIKPENVMLQPVDGRPDMVRLVDFGIAKIVGLGSQTTAVVGTPDYMAPEQLSGKNIGPWTDLYALGTLAFEMLTIKRPFPYENRDELLFRKVDKSYDPTQHLVGGGYPKGLVDFLRRAILYDRRLRYESAEAFRTALGHATAALRDRRHEKDPAAGVSDDALSVGAFESWLGRERQRLDSEREVLLVRTRRHSGDTSDEDELATNPTPMLGTGRDDSE